MSLEGFSKRGMELGNDPEGIRRASNNNSSSINLDYQNSIKRLALTKIKNDLLFEGQLGATLRRLNSLGINITKEKILKDIQIEIYNQEFEMGFNENYENDLESSENKNFRRY